MVDTRVAGQADAGGREGDPVGVVDAYVRLALRLDRVVPGVLDAHLGDPVRARAVACEPPPDAAGLARAARALRREVASAGLSVARATYLEGQLTACAAIADRAAGVEMPVVDEIEACLGVRVGPGDPDRYREAHRALAALLPGTAPLADRLAAFRSADRVPPALLGPAVRALLDALRHRTGALLGLPAGEQVRVEVVDEAPWSGFSRRATRLGSVVSVNAGAPHRMAHLPLLVAHEAYPGHHTEYSRTEAALAAPPPRFPERAVALARTPQSLIAEGAAELGLAALVGPGWGAWNASVLSGHGLNPDGALGEAVEAVMEDLAPVRQDAALILHTPGAGPDAAERAVAHLRRWLLVDEARARRMLEFTAHPRWRIHTTTYVEGVRLLRPWLADRPPSEPVTVRFARLLDEPWTPATLRVGPTAA